MQTKLYVLYRTHVLNCVYWKMSILSHIKEKNSLVFNTETQGMQLTGNIIKDEVHSELSIKKSL